MSTCKLSFMKYSYVELTCKLSIEIHLSHSIQVKSVYL